MKIDANWDLLCWCSGACFDIRSLSFGYLVGIVSLIEGNAAFAVKAALTGISASVEEAVLVVTFAGIFGVAAEHSFDLLSVACFFRRIRVN